MFPLRNLRIPLALLPLLLFSRAHAQPIGYVDERGLPHILPDKPRPAARSAIKHLANGIEFTITFRDVDDATGIGFDDPVCTGSASNGIQHVGN